MSFSCVIIGSGTLPIQCAETLLGRGHRVTRVLSSDPALVGWAEEHDLPCADPRRDLSDSLNMEPFDFLFSIVNEHVLPKAILKIPRMGAINYHDGPLPRYGGVHATSWAIINGEGSHGVTWHEMTEAVDAGNILKQTPVEVRENETAVTLNARCYEEATLSFAELVEELETGPKSGTAQDPEDRTFYGRFRRPEAACCIRWHQDAKRISALVRGLDFGPYPNSLGRPKLAVEGDFVLLREAVATEGESPSPPGTITAIDSNTITVSTATHDLELRALQSVDGRDLPMGEFAEKYGICPGYRFLDLDQVTADRLTARYDAVAKYESFWLDRLSAVRPHRLPRDPAPDPASDRESRHRVVSVPLPSILTELSLVEIPGRNLADFLLGSFLAFLARIGPTESIDIGFRDDSLRRRDPEIDGLFAPWVPFSIKIDHDLGLDAVIPGIKTTTEAILHHQTYARDLPSRHPDLRLTNVPDGDQAWPVSVHRLASSEEHKPLPGSELAFILTEDLSGCKWVYDAGVHTDDSVLRLLRQWETFLDAAATDPGRPIADLPLLGDAERRVLLEEWSQGGELEVPEGVCIHHLFEGQVSADPGRIAIVAEDGSLTYGELNTRANQLAHHLVPLGVGPGTLVGVALPRTTDMVVAVMGVLKAGGAYLPLDPDLPAERLGFMLEDGDAAVLVTHTSVLDSFPPFEGGVVCLDGDRGLEGLPETRPEVEVDPHQLAYVLYTSGSTGRPKGVEVRHRNVVTFVGSLRERPGLSADDVFSAIATLAFDASVMEIFGPLAAGARIVLASQEVARNGPRLRALLEDHGVTVTFATPATLYMLLEAGWEGNRGIRVWTGSEVVSADLAKKLVVNCGEVWNLYGPTEATVVTTAWRVPEDVTEMCIGTPLGNWQVYVLDGRMEPVPVGAAGELYIGGGGVAKGYRMSPELTAERFVADGFSEKPGARLYRTGDRVRFRAGGTLEFMGRLDDQVKIRGLRIELGEIEAVLAEHGAIQQAAVLVQGEGMEARLVSYVVFEGSARVDIREMRRILRRSLPDYMVPSLLVPLDRFPLTHSGKVDRKALASAQAAGEMEGPVHVAPRTPTEETLVGIWAEVLGQEHVGVHDDFFGLGGHSLLATQVLSRVTRDMGPKLPLRSLFEASTVADLAEMIEAAGTGASVSLPPIKPQSREERAPLSFAQQRLWFLDRLGNVGTAYHIPVSVRLHGELDRIALGLALDRIVARHEALRTTFEERESGPVQQIAEVGSGLHLLDYDLDEHPEAEAELRRLIATEANEGFDLEKGPLIRGRLIRLAPDDHVLLLTIHHIVSDGWSIGVLFKELNVLYRAFNRGEADPLPPLEVQYTDYAAKQQIWSEEEVFREQADYWVEALSGAPELLDLPTDHVRPATQDHSGAVVSLEFDEKLTAGLKALSQRHGATLFMTVLAGWASVLSRLSGQEEVVIGAPTANRGRTEIEGLIGFFVNTLALRIDLGGSPTVAELIGRVKAQALEAQDHKDIPFDQVVGLLQPGRSLAYSPLFQVLFTWQNVDIGLLDLPGLTLGSVAGAEREAAKFDLSISLGEKDGRIVGGVEFATALFERETVQRYVRYLRMVLEGMAEDHDQTVHRLPLLSEEERQQVVVAWNATEAAYPSNSLIHELFEEQVERTPDAVAVVFEGARLTYQELNARANKLAHHLQYLGVNPDARVAICVERNLEMVVGLLGVLKAGGAYVPLDPSFPSERLQFMLEDSEPVALLMHGPLVELFPGLPDGMPVVDLQADSDAWADQLGTNPDRESTGLTQDHLAYLTYTSGSTGWPKGVFVVHRGVLNLVNWYSRELELSEDDAVLIVTTHSFDLTYRNLFAPLAAGGQLHLASEPFDPQGILTQIVDSGITMMNLTPTAFHALIDATGDGELGGLRLVALAGEAAQPRKLMELSEPRPEFINLYGPTECSGIVGYHRMSPDLASYFGRSVPLGQPISNTRIYLLDGGGEPVPVGVVGEISVGGVAVARGYLNRPTLTADRFVADPFSGVAGSRLYRTGDLGRWRKDGTIEFLGRNDFQVKVRGFRIELGEIEAHLGEHPDVQAAAVLAREDAAGDKRLVAYHVGGGAVEAEVLRTHLAQRLPEYMVPAAYVSLDALPLTQSGKVNRIALPAPGSDAFVTRGYEAPVGEMEVALAEIWSEVLGKERVGRWDHFFDLGGHSLLAAQIVSRVRRALPVEVALGDLFLRPALADFAGGLKLAGGIETSGSGTSAAPSPIERRIREDRAPLSFAQQRLWFLDRMEERSDLYNLPLTLGLTGILDRDALRRSFGAIVARHEVLRTTFPDIDGVPYQAISPASAPANWEWTETDVGEIGDEEALGELLRKEAWRSFDLASGPLFRVGLFCRSREDHVLQVVTHHSISDLWSVGVFRRELSALYAAFTAGDPSPLQPLPIQYADYSAWQQAWLQGEVLEGQMGYWRRQLEGLTPLELPTDRPRPPAQSYKGGQHRFRLPSALTEGLKALGRQEGTTLFMTLMTAFHILLHRYSGQPDIAVGTPIAGRNWSELEGLMGMFVNTLVIRSQVTPRLPFRELLRAIKHTSLDAHAHQDLPFERLVEELQPTRDLSLNPLFQVMFALQNTPDVGLTLPGLETRALTVTGEASKFDLSVSLWASGEKADNGAMEGSWSYSTDLFDATTIQRMQGHFQTLLTGIVADPDAPVDDLALMGEEECRVLVEEWGRGPELEAPERACIHHLFEARVAEDPDRVAVVAEDGRLTYYELNAKANQLARHLVDLGLEPEALVGISLPRTTDMVVAVLGILKAGAAYLPLDPDLPRERLRYMVEDAMAPIVLTTTELQGSLPFFEGLAVNMDRDEEVFGTLPHGPLGVRVDPTQLAYTMYTSGSTGQPKGVEVTHANVVNFLISMEQRPGLSSDDVLLAVTRLSFDLSVLEIFGTLGVGGRVVVASQEVAGNGPRLQALMEESGANLMTSTPATWRMLFQAGWNGNPYLRALVGGEAFPPDLARDLENCCGEVWNMYGPTEATVYSSIWKVPPDVDRISIGTPIGNTQSYVLDTLMRPVPIGTAGELFIGGAAVTPGYRNRTELTAERFVPDPFSQLPGARLYRTGDRARFCDDGTVDYMGRLDHQVKIRGYRIELGEIEAVLQEHEAVWQATVLVHGEEVDAHLTAYLVFEDGARFDLRGMRTYLRQFLPDYMVPSLLIEMTEFPLTSSGKVDREALPSPEAAGVMKETTRVAPRTPTEETLVGIWAEVLGQEQLGVHDDFFGLGGHSLLATQILSRVARDIEVELPLRSLFEAPTVAELAELIEAAGPETSLSLPPIERRSREDWAPLSYAQQRLWFLDRIEGQSDLYNIPLGFEMTGSLDVHVLQQSLDAIVSRHDALRTHFPEVDGIPHQAKTPAGSPDSWEWAMTDAGPEEKATGSTEMGKDLREHAIRPFDLAAGPLFRAKLFRRSEEHHILQVVMHHTVFDGWSEWIFRRELSTLYSAFLSGDPSPLPPLPIQYSDYSVCQQGWLQGEVLERHMDYWRQQLAGLKPLDMLTDHPRPPLQSFEGKTHRFHLSQALSDSLRALSRREGSTLFMTLMAAFQLFLHRYSGQEDIAVGTPIAGRTRVEVEGLLGMFVNTLVIRSNLSGDLDFRELLAKVRDTTLEAQAYQDLPFEKLVEEMQPQRDLSRNPLFQVMFALQNEPDAELTLPGLEASPLALEKESSKFDLSLALWENGEPGENSRIEGIWTYATDLFDCGTIQRMQRHFQRLLEGLVRAPDVPIAEIPLLSEGDRKVLVEEWSQGAEMVVPEGVCIHDLFEARVAEAPDRLAVVAENGSLTYGELNAKANQLARHLVALGVGPEVLVGVSLPRTTDMVVAVMGTLKAGGAYLPLDPDLPAERLGYMLEDGDAPVLVTQTSVLESFPTFEGDVVCLDGDSHVLGALPETNPEIEIDPHQLAYVLYTSGSTGRPKGVEVLHRNVVSYVGSIVEWPGLSADDVFLAVATLSFDVSVLEFFGSLAVGARVVLASWEAVRDGPKLRALAESQGVTVANCTPATLYMLLEAGWQGNEGMRVWTGSEIVPMDLAKKLLVGCGEVWNLYGPTETTVTATAWRIPADVEEMRIGTPLGNFQTYVLDSRVEPVPVGVPGELYIGGESVARGYRNRPELTAERFVVDRFSGKSEARLYRTGDQVRYDEGGILEFLGRLDGQVKIRGLRIELGEVESVLREGGFVRQAAVLVHGEGVNARLVAYVVLEDGVQFPVREMRRTLRTFLPDYMIPSQVVALDELPLTPSGKIDRKALPHPDTALQSEEGAFVAPRTWAEKALVSIWAEVLGRERVGIHDDFFALGGHSLLATQVISRVVRDMEVEIPLRSLFEAPTVAELAERVEAQMYVQEARDHPEGGPVEEVEI